MAARKTTTAVAEKAAKPVDKERNASLRKAYAQADKALRDAYPEEWKTLLEAALREHGVSDVRRRLTAEEKAAREEAKRQEKIARLKEQIAALGGEPLFGDDNEPSF